MNRLDISVKEVLGRAGLIVDDSSKVVVIENIKFEFNEHISDAFIKAEIGIGEGLKCYWVCWSHAVSLQSSSHFWILMTTVVCFNI